MRLISAHTWFGPLFLSIFLLAFTALHAQAPAAGTTVAVKILDTVDSSSDPVGKQYRASVIKAVTAANGVAIAQASPATVTLTSSGAGYTAQLSSITINGQTVAVTSNSGTVSAAAQYAQSRASSAVGSVLGSLGHHVNTPASIAAAASGQHVFLPAGTTLTFVLNQSPATTAASPGVPNVAAASVAPARPAAAPVATAGQHWWMCRYQDKKDPANAALGSLMYYALLPASDAASSGLNQHFNTYVQQNYKINDPNAGGKGFCRKVSDDAAGRSGSMDMFQKQWRSSNVEPVQVNFADTAAQGAATGAQPQSAPVGNSKECAYHATCAAAPAPAPKPISAPAGPSASRPPWFTQCRYQGLKGGQQVVYITPIIHTELAASDISTAFEGYMLLIYNVGNITAGGGGCTTKMSSSADQQAYTEQQLEKQWADSKTPVTHLDWTGTPAEIAAANSAQAATATPPAGMAAPNAALREFYVFCYTDPSAPTIYFSDVFVGKADPSHQIGVSFRTIQNEFVVFLQQKYSAKVGPSCVGRTSASPQAPGSKQLLESQFKQANKQAQVVETEWKK